mgnify:CR=1 FL=1
MFVVYSVTPFTGVWIEIFLASEHARVSLRVTPFTGVWIEIVTTFTALVLGRVTPFTGVWIEICRTSILAIRFRSHTLHGCVD